MGESTIEWLNYARPDGTIVPGYTFNPVIGCAKKSPGCKFCYAENDAPARVARGNNIELWGVKAQRKVTGPNYWRQPQAWNLAAGLNNETRLVFTASQSDWLENREEWREPRAKLLRLIFETPNLTWLLLSKEPWNFNVWLNDAAMYWAERQEWLTAESIDQWRWGYSVPENVRLGVSVESQEWANKRRSAFEKLPGKKFVSYEPALGPVNWDGWEFVDQIISGGESGKGVGIRPSHPQWHRDTRDWCSQNRKAHFFKQWGAWKPISEMSEAENNALYRSNVIAKNPHDQAKFDELYGRTCKVQTSAIGYSGVLGMDEAFWVDRHGNNGISGYQVFRVGKKNAGNFLDGRQHLEIPGINFPPSTEQEKQ